MEVSGLLVGVREGVVAGGGSCVTCVFLRLSWAGRWLGVVEGVVVGGGCVSGDGF